MTIAGHQLKDLGNGCYEGANEQGFDYHIAPVENPEFKSYSVDVFKSDEPDRNKAYVETFEEDSLVGAVQAAMDYPD